ncbi:MAG TPA: ArsR family transcriptional regulator [Vicinamibacterales bacterium]|jgi:predicted ArsR family transcriptional regulator
MLRHQLLDTSRGRIVTILQQGELTVEEIAVKLKLTANAIRAQLAGMERDGVIRRVGRRPGTTRPSHVFQLTPEVEQLLSKAYIPLLTQLVDVFATALPAEQLNGLLRDAGRRLAEELPAAVGSKASLGNRVNAASKILNEQLGALTAVERNTGYVIRGKGCPLSALTGKHPAVCLALESLVTEIVGAPVHECCDRASRPRCCFQIEA